MILSLISIIRKKEPSFESELSKEILEILDDMYKAEHLEEYVRFLESKIYIEENPYQIFSYYISLATILLFIYIRFQITTKFKDKLKWSNDFILRIKSVKLIPTFANIPPPSFSFHI